MTAAPGDTGKYAGVFENPAFASATAGASTQTARSHSVFMIKQRRQRLFGSLSSTAIMTWHVTVVRNQGAVALLAIGLAAAAAVSLSAASVPAPPSPDARAQLNGARANLVEHFALVQTRCRCAGSLQTRLDSELARLAEADPGAQADSSAALLASLEEGLIDQLVSGRYRGVGSIRDAGSTLIESKYDNSVQPLSVFVPPAYSAQKSVPLVVMLHAADQSENELLSLAQLRQLASATGVLLALPWARGDDIASAAAASDTYDALDATEAAFSVDRRRVYLAGVSLGGIALFKIGPAHPDRWTAFLSIAGTFTNDDLSAVGRNLRGKQVFMVAGGDDTFVKPSYIKAASAWLTSNGIESHYYEQPRGEHSFASLDPAIERAWRDMLSGVRINSSQPDFEMPSPQPTPSQKN